MRSCIITPYIDCTTPEGTISFRRFAHDINGRIRPSSILIRMLMSSSLVNLRRMLGRTGNMYLNGIGRLRTRFLPCGPSMSVSSISGDRNHQREADGKASHSSALKQFSQYFFSPFTYPLFHHHPSIP